MLFITFKSLLLACVATVALAQNTIQPPPTITTTAVNGIKTPTPILTGMVDNCDDFYLVAPSDTCVSIARKKGITVARFVTWNPAVGGGACTGLQQDKYVCVHIVGYPPTPINPDNGIKTPTPILPNMVTDCDSFYLVKSGDTCQSIPVKSGISVARFVTWNPDVGGVACTGLRLDTYVCVHIIGFPPNPTTPGNGVTTPQPI